LRQQPETAFPQQTEAAGRAHDAVRGPCRPAPFVFLPERVPARTGG
jgi:hypothetical protein